MSKTLFTAGYGNQKPEDFLARLKDAGVTVVLDVRREGSGARLSVYRPGKSIAALFATAGIHYRGGHPLGNVYDTLEEYREWVTSDCGMKWINVLAYNIQSTGNDVCLLCAERDAYKFDDEKWKCRGAVNCHRVYVADALVEILGNGWEVCHL